ncbi:hypothetical protein NDU88_007607 [Pleurodeles waltl]|uniref:Uncharacterized protein n=1 Tax=Pleurodeles waltl TaxID=8319 RepID=A0AAV7STA9_PLEWA|nr:hypothetical protein NDU88_007607 [Pleurodeles waltl]
MWEGGGTKRLALAVREENDEEQDGDKEGRDGGKEEQEGDEEDNRGQRNLESGEWLLPSRGEEEDKAADRGLRIAVTLGSGMQNHATLLEKGGIARCVNIPY